MTATGRTFLRTNHLNARAISSRNHSQENRRLSPDRGALPRPEWLPESVWPFQTFGLEANRSVVAVTDVGEGPTLVFVHTGVRSFIWRDVMERLSRDYRCVCLDAPGTGQSSR